ncbi:MAG: single-stranded-DNA-specific exonuclease RecJ [Minisyncoccia bacterium]
MTVALHPVIEEILAKRGLSEADRENFLNPKYEKLHDPFLMKDMDKAVSRIKKAFDNGETIAVYSDYDADGIPGGVMLRKALEQGGAKVFPYIPDRHVDGFGFHANSIPLLKEKGVGLIITVDCGIANNEEVNAAEDAGIDVIITDHHEAQGELPKAYAILNPMQPNCEYPFKGLCGAGVAFKLVQALQQKNVLKLADGQEKWLLDLVAIATIADMVPLIDENRIFAHFGLRVLQKSRRKGLQALISSLRLRNITEDDVAFSIAPRINAASRMGEARLAYDLLATEDDKEAITLTRELEGVNNSRKGVVAAIVKEANTRILEGSLHQRGVLVLGSTHWRPSLLGLVATNLVEKYGAPVFLWGEDGSGEIRGSCRGNGIISVHDLMSEAKDSFMQFGGHKQAGGFTVVKEQIHHLADALISAKEKLVHKDNEKKDLSDAVVSLTDINNHFLKSLFALRPFGLANERPLFHFPKTWTEETKMFGKTAEHLEIIFSQGEKRARAIKFFAGDLKNKTDAGTIDIFGNIEEDPFKGRDAWRVRIIDII